MFAIEPYFAERQASGQWRPCRVIGVCNDGSALLPQFVVEYEEDGYSYLAIADCVRKRERSGRQELRENRQISIN